MTDTTGALTASPAEGQQIPKSRLDEEIANRRRAEQEADFLRKLVATRVPNAAPQKVEEPEELKRLKEENPVLYNEIKSLRAQVKQTSAHNFQVAEALDRSELEKLGQDAKRMLPDIEAKLQELRAQGHYHYNRGQIYYHLKGVEAAHRAANPVPAAAPTTQAASGGSQATDNVPGSDPKTSAVLTGGSTAAQKRPETLEELEARLAEVEF